MKARMLENVMGLAAGAEVEVIVAGPLSTTVRTASGDTVVPTGALEIQQEDTPKPVAAVTDSLVERQDHGDTVEALARYQYNAYNEAVGGVAWNGDKLPAADEFFEDPAKQKQANAWRVATAALLDHMRDLGVIPNPAVEEEDPAQGTLQFEVPSVVDEGAGEVTVGLGNPVDPEALKLDEKPAEG